MGTFVMILAYIFVICEALWYFTCTEHKEIPLILILCELAVSLIPGLNILMAVINIFLLCWMVCEDTIELKDNWFNRKFLAYRE